MADEANNRVLEYNDPLTSQTADRVVRPARLHARNSQQRRHQRQSLYGPYGLALDAGGNLYVADATNNRVLEYNHPLTNQTADTVFGQADFTHNEADQGGSTAADSLSDPYGAAIDPAGNLYVADASNNRVLEYDQPLANPVPTLASISPAAVPAGSPAFRLTVNGTGFVAGSVVRWNGADLTTTYWSSYRLNATVPASDVATGGPFPITVFTPGPGGGATSSVDLALYDRVGHDTRADQEWGQPAFLANGPDDARLLPDSRLNSPQDVAVDAASGRLFVADTYNDRVLSWPSAAAQANGQPADLVLGQANLFATGADNGGLNRAR